MRSWQLVTLLLLITLQSSCPLLGQINYTANDLVIPYEGHFGYGSNLGYYPPLTTEELGDLAFGNAQNEIEGAGITTLRSALFGHFQEDWGYDFRIPTFEYYQSLGDTDHVLFLGYPPEKYRDTTFYCDTMRSELYANLYEPIWDDGLNGTPVNEDNYYANYVYKTVTLYKDYVKFWEVWNEPDYSFSASSIHGQEEENSWWNKNPNPCDYDIHAPIFHYIRMLRISYEVIKSIDEGLYVAIGGIGYPSFLDAVLRNTDNPNNGSISEDFPLGGGAYFDVLSYHVYPHIDGSLRTWNNQKRQFDYMRNSDEAVKGVIDLRDRFREVLFDYGYNGNIYPRKEWIITESNVPRKPLNGGFGSDEVQRNFIVKALVESQKNDIKQFHIFTLGDKWDEADAQNKYDEYQIMGLYDRLINRNVSEVELNDVGIAYRTCARLLHKKRFAPNLFQDLLLPPTVNGGVFTSDYGKKVYVLWAVATQDQSEQANYTLNLSKQTGTKKFIQHYWHSSERGDSVIVSGQQIQLNSTPIFLTPLEEEDNPLEARYALEVFPNPFSDRLTIKLNVENAQSITLRLINQMGVEVVSLLDDEWKESGEYKWVLDDTLFEGHVFFLEYIIQNEVKRVLIIKES